LGKLLERLVSGPHDVVCGWYACESEALQERLRGGKAEAAVGGRKFLDEVQIA